MSDVRIPRKLTSGFYGCKGRSRNGIALHKFTASRTS
jgi:hypothetical protein